MSCSGIERKIANLKLQNINFGSKKTLNMLDDNENDEIETIYKLYIYCKREKAIEPKEYEPFQRPIIKRNLKILSKMYTITYDCKTFIDKI